MKRFGVSRHELVILGSRNILICVCVLDYDWSQASLLSGTLGIVPRFVTATCLSPVLMNLRIAGGEIVKKHIIRSHILLAHISLEMSFYNMANP